MYGFVRDAIDPLVVSWSPRYGVPDEEMGLRREREKEKEKVEEVI